MNFPSKAINLRADSGAIQCFLVDSGNIEQARTCTFSLYPGFVTSIQKITFTSICSSTCTAGQQTLRIKNIRNPLSEEPINLNSVANYFGILVLTTQGYSISFGKTSNVQRTATTAPSFKYLYIYKLTYNCL